MPYAADIRQTVDPLFGDLTLLIIDPVAEWPDSVARHERDDIDVDTIAIVSDEGAVAYRRVAGSWTEVPVTLDPAGLRARYGDPDHRPRTLLLSPEGKILLARPGRMPTQRIKAEVAAWHARREFYQADLSLRPPPSSAIGGGSEAALAQLVEQRIRNA